MSAASLPARPLALSACLGLAAAIAAAALLAEPVRALMAEASATDAYDPARLVLLYSTLPRLAMAVLCGAALGLSGAILQQVLRNPLASPTTIGIDAGAGLALTLTTLFAPALFGFGRDLVALGGSAVSTLLVFALVRRQDFAPVPLVLAGLVVTLYCGAISAMMTLLDSRYLVSLFIWGAGSLSQQSWDPAVGLAIRLAVVAPFALLLVRPLQLLDVGDAGARALGLPVGLVRALAVGLAMLLAAFVSSTVGIIGFVGLVAPLLARLSGARSFGARLFWSCLFGALLLLLTDLGVQLLAGVYADLLPTGAVTAILGSPILLWLLPRLALGGRPPLAGAARHAARAGSRKAVALALCCFVLVVLVAVFVGRAPGGAWSLLAPGQWAEILPFRLPRIVACGAAGTCLAVAGLTLQRMTGNEMASPEILGISAGATIAVAVALFLAPVLTPGVTFLAASLGALVVLAGILAFGRRSGFAPERVLLAGIAINALLDAMVGVLSATGDPRAVMLLAWMGGSTSGLFATDAIRAVGLAATAGLVALLSARWLAILPLGAPQAKALGVSPGRARLVLLLLIAGATAAATPIVGPLTFAGLMAPHIVRMLAIHRPVPAIAASALAGAFLLVTADWLARVLAYPFQLPTGILAALVGAPFLLWLLQARRLNP